MITELLYQQKEERDLLLSKSYFLREKTSILQKAINGPLIKVIIGPRRAGKSVLALLALKKFNFAYINFDDDVFANHYKNGGSDNTDKILEAIFTVYKNPTHFLFDEIQTLPKWELFVSKLQRRNYNIILTGSNAKLLSSELATHLTGRYYSLEILPFGILEYLNFLKLPPTIENLSLPRKKAQIIDKVEFYLSNGGYPEIVTGTVYKHSYLATLFDAILLKDVARRFKVRSIEQLYNLATYLLSNATTEFSYNSLSSQIGFSSVLTCQRYLRYLTESYLFFTVKRFSCKTKLRQKSPQKIYVVDNGIITAKALLFMENKGRLLENIVFLELLRRGFNNEQNIFYYRTQKNREIDFVVNVSGDLHLIQVCLNLNDSKTREREVNAFIDASGELRKIKSMTIVTLRDRDEIQILKTKIKVIPLHQWARESL